MPLPEGRGIKCFKPPQQPRTTFKEALEPSNIRRGSRARFTPRPFQRPGLANNRCLFNQWCVINFFCICIFQRIFSFFCDAPQNGWRYQKTGPRNAQENEQKKKVTSYPKWLKLMLVCRLGTYPLCTVLDDHPLIGCYWHISGMHLPPHDLLLSCFSVASISEWFWLIGVC